MNLHEYLQRRAKNRNISALTKKEADLMSIPWPLPKGWPKRYGKLLIDDALLVLLDDAFKKRRDKVIKLRAEKKAGKKNVKNLAVNTTFSQEEKKPKIYGYDGFYATREWRELRYRALVVNGAKCQCCGATRYDGVRLHVDHINPRSKFPELQLELSNLQVLCEDCNLGKSNKDSTDWR